VSGKHTVTLKFYGDFETASLHEIEFI
jgi:hypothetical protein